jgi:thymidylate kinase
MPKTLIDIVNTSHVQPPDTLLSGLPIVRRLLDRLHQEDIEYCHWKSNKHVLQGMIGETDLDVLVAKKNFLLVSEVLCQTGYKRVSTVNSCKYSGVEDYLAMEPSTGKLVHIHLHYRLVLGEPHLKGYRVPWEHIVLSSRIFLTQFGIFTSCPEVEMILLFVRAALKLRMRNRILARFGQSYPNKDIVSEFLWLKERIDFNRCQEYAAQMLGEKSTTCIKNILGENRLTYNEIKNFRILAMDLLRNYRSYGVVYSNIRRWQREAIWAFGVMNKRYLHLPIPFRRTPPAGGLVVALVGCDGSGKSTQIKSIVKWLSWKLDVLPIYFGSGDGSSSILRWPLKLIAHIITRRGRRANFSPQVTNGLSFRDRNHNSWYKRLGRVPWAFFLALEKKKKMRIITRARNRGLIVICDRFPQNQVKGFNDGPLLANLAISKFRWMRRFAAWEESCYATAKMAMPDIVVKLHVTPEVAFSRKPEMALTEIQKRIDAVRLLQFDSNTTVFHINATEPLEQVTLRIKQNIWGNL